MKRILFAMLAFSLLIAAGCESQEEKDKAALDKVRQTVIPNCNGKTLDDLATGLLQSPAWNLEKDAKKVNVKATLQGTIAGDSLPEWVKDQKLMDITFHFPLDPQTGAYDATKLEGFPSISTPEGVLQAYKLLICQ